jgi:hypothetical protein
MQIDISDVPPLCLVCEFRTFSPQVNYTQLATTAVGEVNDNFCR